MTPHNPGAQRLTPAELQTVNFRRAPIGRRGFDEDQVRAFLRQVEHELVRVLNEKAATQHEVGRLRDRITGARRACPRPRPRTLTYRPSASSPRHRRPPTTTWPTPSATAASSPSRRAGAVMRSSPRAKARAVMVLDEAHRQASTAAEEGRPSTEPLSEEERRDLEREIAYLRTFSDVYRTHLRSYLEALLRNVEEWEHSENASLPSRAPLPRSR